METDSDLIEFAVGLNKKSIGELISIFENPQIEQAERKQNILSILKIKSHRNAVFIGLTGAPGTGKSSLIGKIAIGLIRERPDFAVAVLAVDPTSRITGGSILGDRIRSRFPPDENRLFFRSQASENETGGAGRGTFQVTRLLRYLFDIVLIETVGTGQEDTEIAKMTDYTMLVLQPNSGDRMQYIKAGIMEIPDCILLNKYDLNSAEESFHDIENSIHLTGQNKKPLLIKASAATGMGLEKITQTILEVNKKPDEFERELFYLEKWVKTEYGNHGTEIIRRSGGFEKILKEAKDFEKAILEAGSLIIYRPC